MTAKTVDSIRRTGRATSKTRQIVVVQGSGKHAVETVLSTTITKIDCGLQFRFGAARVPVEQYAFKVGAKTVERFADATALVLKRHNIVLSGNAAEAQTYVQKAFDIVNGKAELHEVNLDELMATSTPAVAEAA